MVLSAFIRLFSASVYWLIYIYIIIRRNFLFGFHPLRLCVCVCVLFLYALAAIVLVYGPSFDRLAHKCPNAGQLIRWITTVIGSPLRPYTKTPQPRVSRPPSGTPGACCGKHHENARNVNFVYFPLVFLHVLCMWRAAKATAIPRTRDSRERIFRKKYIAKKCRPLAALVLQLCM